MVRLVAVALSLSLSILRHAKLAKSVITFFLINFVFSRTVFVHASKFRCLV